MTTKIFLLDGTPPQYILIVVLFLAVYAVQYGIAPVIRLQQFAFIPNYVLLIPIVLLGLLAVQGKHYQPMLAGGLKPIMKGVIPSWFSYSGPEFLIGLLYPFITAKKSVFKWGAASIVFIMIIYTLINVITQGILGPKEVAYVVVPTVIAYRSVEIPDTFIERLDGYVMIVLIPLYFCSLVNYLYICSFLAVKVLKLEDNRAIAVLFVPLIYFFAVLAPNMQTSDAVNKVVNMLGIVWGLIILPLLLLLAWLREKRLRSC